MAREEIFLDWESGEVHCIRGTLVAHASANVEVKEHLVITDARALYDMMKQGAGVRSKEPNATLTTAELRQILVLGLQTRWTPHNFWC